MRDPTRRFADRVDDYVRYRPDYPDALLDLLGPPRTIVELGAGTGILTGQLMARGHDVIAVEPNAQMREVCVASQIVAGTAEDTGLPEGIADAVVAAQAFHWFDPVAAARECRRLLAEQGSAWLIWNNRVAGDERMEAYDALLREHGTDYEQVARTDVDGAVASFFEGDWITHRLPHHQDLDREGLRGRIRSCSYVPAPGEPGHEALMAAADRLFDAHAPRFRLSYETLVLQGRPLRSRSRPRQPGLASPT